MSYTCSESGDASGFRGCGRTFGSLDAFSHHWLKVADPDDPERDRATVAITGERCMTDEELASKGIEREADGKYRDVEAGARLKAVFGRG